MVLEKPHTCNRMSAVTELLQELVRIPSVNPQGDPGTPHIGEGPIAQFIGDFMVKLGMEVELQFADKDRPNVIGRLKSKNPKHHILLGPHLDTVSVVGMTIDPFSGKQEGGRIWGRGACDTKGPMASILVAIQNLTQQKRAPQNTDIWFTGLMGEESGNDGIAFLMESDFFKSKNAHVNFGIAGEPTDLKVVHRHKGALWIRIRARGRSCHASRPDLGENAILKILPAIEYVSNDLLKLTADWKDPVLGGSTFNITTIRGGSKVNIIPDLCEIEVDHRSLPQESHQEIIEKIQKALPQCEIEIVSDRPGLDTPKENPYIQKLSDVLLKTFPSQSKDGFLVGAPWFADCSLMAKGGIPSIAFGPGSIQQAHTKDEYIEIQELEKGVKVFEDFLSSLE
jgi:acetylornithine deacetylase/succinyl-diaminopimelate desuccinylase family protein